MPRGTGTNRVAAPWRRTSRHVAQAHGANNVRHVEVLARVEGLSASEIYALVSDFARYPEYSLTVRSVKLTTAGDGRFISDWEVNFREGILRWKEEDTFLDDELIIRFRQIEGDVDYFVGEWSVIEDQGGCIVRFASDF